jgi:lysophospholipase L1-like esterase
MKQQLTGNINSSGVVSYGMTVMLIFMVIMKQYENISCTYLALGDSYTIGEQVAGDENFPSQVTALLQQKGLDISAPVIVAKTGWTTDELADAIKKAELKTCYDFVTLLIGVNNQYRGRPVADYIPEFEALLKQAIRFAGNDSSHVIVLSIPDWGVTPFAADRNRDQVAREIDAYNSANEQIASKYKVHYINITGSTREAEKDLSLLTADRLHPSAKEYARWARQVAAIIENEQHH